LNFKFECKDIDVDDYITPLILASFFGRIDAVNVILSSKSIDINAPTQPAGTLF